MRLRVQTVAVPLVDSGKLSRHHTHTHIHPHTITYSHATHSSSHIVTSHTHPLTLTPSHPHTPGGHRNLQEEKDKMMAAQIVAMERAQMTARRSAVSLILPPVSSKCDTNCNIDESSSAQFELRTIQTMGCGFVPCMYRTTLSW